MYVAAVGVLVVVVVAIDFAFVTFAIGAVVIEGVFELVVVVTVVIVLVEVVVVAIAVVSVFFSTMRYYDLLDLLPLVERVLVGYVVGSAGAVGIAVLVVTMTGVGGNVGNFLDSFRAKSVAERFWML